MLKEIAGGVEELLRDDRRAQPDVGERQLTAGRANVSAELEVPTHVGDIELQNTTVHELSHAAVVVSHQFHVFSLGRVARGVALRSPCH